jgi:hypothetical protein
LGESWGQTLTLRRSSPWEMFSASMKADTRWWMGPASPQCGLSTNVWKPLCLRHEDRAGVTACTHLCSQAPTTEHLHPPASDCVDLR